MIKVAKAIYMYLFVNFFDIHTIRVINIHISPPLTVINDLFWVGKH